MKHDRAAGSLAAAPAGAGGFRRVPRDAFTLLEILISIALLALLAGTVVSLSAHLIGDKAVTPGDVFWKALTEARKEALLSEQEVSLAFDEKNKAFVISAAAGEPKSFPVPAADQLGVDFLPPRTAGTSSVLLGGELVETGGMPSVTFYPDGTCSSFRAQFRNGGAAWTIAIDPWTCAEMFEVKK